MIPIVVMAHGRPRSLERLLQSVVAAELDHDTSIEISIDPGSPQQAAVEAVAQRFEWPHGDKQVVVGAEPLGLVGHFAALGDRAGAQGDFVLLEDDLEVGPGFARWAEAALAAYRDEPAVGGLSLNALWFNGFDQSRFEPVLDGSDAFFAQVPWYHGMVFTSEWWAEWRSRRSSGASASSSIDRGLLPPAYGALGAEEWFGDMAAWLVETGRSFVFPRRSHSTNHAEAGVHFDRRSSWFQTAVELRSVEPRLVPFDESMSRYDGWLEFDSQLLRTLVPDLPADVVVDLHGLRRLHGATPVLTSNLVIGSRRTWGTTRRPLIANVLAGEPGEGLALSSADEVRLGRWALRRGSARRRRYAAHSQPPGVARALGDRLANQLDLRDARRSS